MAQNKINKLELTWIGKEDEPLAIEPRLLIDTPEYSFGAVETGTLPNGKQWPGNMLIHGDNLLALRALEQDFAGQIKCIYIDPPYNTGSAFEHYDDNREHSIWLSLMRERLVILHKLLSKDGSIWISLDDEEQAYCKVLCDEIFGRTNFVANVIWHKKHTRANDARWFSDNHDFILVYAKDKANWKINLLPRPKDSANGYTNPDNDPRGVWASNPCHVKTPSESCIYPIVTPSGRQILPPNGRSWMCSKERFEELIADNRIWFGKNGDNAPRLKKFLTEVKDGFVPLTIWMRDEVGDNQEAKTEAKSLVADDVFATPKPERLIERILTLGSNPGDIVLDSFLGSGTTAAVAHKMGRKWIGVELGNHAYTHSAMRMKKVIEGEQGGISKSHNWQGGGGFRFYELAPSLLNKDKYGNLVINKDYNADMLAAAMAKHQGFTFSPDAELYWKQGRSSEHDFIFTTTQLITAEMLETIHDQLGEDESLLICCTKFQPECRNKFSSITIKKIPKVLLDTCEFDHNDYSLNIVSVPVTDLSLAEQDIDDEEWSDIDPEGEYDPAADDSNE